MQNGILGNASKEYVDQRLRDSPLHKLRLKETCSKPIQNPVIELHEDGNYSEAD
jgi:hypothetical protein